MLRRGLVLGSIALMCFATGAAAQSIAPLRFGVALGTAFEHSEWWWPDGGQATLSLASQRAGSRFGLRVEAMFDYNSSASSGPDGRSSASQHRTMGLTINGTYHLRGRSTGLYAIAGVGVYRHWGEARTHDFPLSPEVRAFNSATPGANLGLGYDFMALDREMFVEARLHTGLGGERVPLAVGIRF